MIISFDKSTQPIWNKIKRFFFMDELPEDMIDLIDEIYHNLNEPGRHTIANKHYLLKKHVMKF